MSPSHTRLSRSPNPMSDQRIAPACRALVRVIETLLAQRRQQTTRRSPATYYKRWTREELCDSAYISYRSVLIGKVRLPPRAEDVAHIAAYFECTLDEHNILLHAAGHPITQHDLQGRALEHALHVGATLVSANSLPAAVITRDWALHTVNSALLRFLGIQAMPEALRQRTILHMLFDPQLHARHLLERAEQWDMLARAYIALFQQQQELCLYEPWHDALIAQLLRLPDFASYWNDARACATASPLAADHVPKLSGTDTTWYRTVTHFAGATYPQVWTYVPEPRE